MSSTTIQYTISHDVGEGCLLVANPMLSDSVFARSVIYIFEHSDTQTQGFILNLPTRHNASDGLEASSFDTSLHQIPIHTGGPVDEDRLYFVSMLKQDEDTPAAAPYHALVGLTADQAADEICKENAQVRCFAGRSTWEPQQILEEIKHHYWLVVPAPNDLLSWKQDESLWQKTLQHTSPFHHLISLTSKNIRWN